MDSSLEFIGVEIVYRSRDRIGVEIDRIGAADLDSRNETSLPEIRTVEDFSPSIKLLTKDKFKKKRPDTRICGFKCGYNLHTTCAAFELICDLQN